MAFTLQIHIQVSDDVEKAVKRTKRQSQWTLLDPRTGRPVGWVTIFIFRDHDPDYCDHDYDQFHFF